MPRRTYPHSKEAAPPPAGDFHGYLGRVLSDGYRVAVMVLDDEIEASAALRLATMSAWLAAGHLADADLDDEFRRRLDADLQDAISGDHSSERKRGVSVEPLEAGVAAVGPRQQIVLARAFGPWESAAPLGGERSSPNKETVEALRTLQARLDSSDAPTPRSGDTKTQLRALYASRDPGEPAPFHVRMRLQQDLREAEAAAAERARLARRSGWGFVFNAFLAVIVLTLVIALASILGVRSSPVVAGDPTSDPATPLTISGVSLVQGAIDGPEVHVGATQRSLIASFESSPLWRLSPRECNADIVGVVDWEGQATWIGQRAGHANSIVGDPSSMNAYISGLGQYCEVGRFASTDGGMTWSGGALPGGTSTEPSWLAFDPGTAHLLLAYYPGTLYASTDSGATWTSRTSTVAPIAFDSAGRLVGWSPGKLFDSLDDGLSWQETGPGPADAPVAAGANSGGVLIGAKDGLWWYPLSAAASLVEPGSVFSIATLGNGAVVLGADSAGHPWLGTVDAAMPGIALATLPPDLAGLHITGGGVAVNDGGAIVAFGGTTSAIAQASFQR